MSVQRDYDHVAVSALEDPYEILSDFRANCPVAQSSLYGGAWFLFRYQDVHDAARATGVFSSAQGVTFPKNAFPQLPPIEYDPPLHNQYRAPLMDRFSPRAVAQREAAVRETFDILIDAVIETGRTDGVADIVRPATGRVMANLFGMPEDLHSVMAEIAIAVMENDNVDEPDMETVSRLFALFAQVYEDRLAQPKDDLPSAMLRMEIDGRPLEIGEFLGLCSVIFVGGLDTSATAGGYILEWLAKHPEQKAWLAEDLARVPAAVEEFIRYITPLHTIARRTTCPADVGGVPIPEGDTVNLVWLAANHDEAEFPKPDEVILDRTPNRHFGFGAGPHRCLGAHVARLEMRVLLEEVLTRMPDFHLDPDREVVRFGGITRGMASVPLAFSPGRRITPSTPGPG